MKGLEFPIIGTKVKGVTRKFEINSPAGRKEYLQAKFPQELKQIRNYLRTRTFIAYMIGKKNSGKGTYSQIFREIFGPDKIELVSVGDLVREYYTNWASFAKSKDYQHLRQIYRGYISFAEAVKTFLGKSQEKLLPTEFVLALLKLKIEKLKGKSIFIDGLPREADQISYSLFFRDLVEYRDDPDIFVLIDIPEAVIDERIKYRVVCPKCKLTRNLKLLPTSKIGYDSRNKQSYLICDNPNCTGKERMLPKEGDELGIEPIRPRLIKDEDILRRVYSLHGVPVVLLRNHVPVAGTKRYFDAYEITPEYVYKYNTKTKKVEINEKPWSVKDDNGVECYSLLAAPVAGSMLKQIAKVLV